MSKRAQAIKTAGPPVAKKARADAGSVSGGLGASRSGPSFRPQEGDSQSRRPSPAGPCAEKERLKSCEEGGRPWKRWGPYLSERQWGTVREDYTNDGSCWSYFPHEHARSRTYRWGEDGLLGFSDDKSQLCLSLGLWNGKDRMLKERLFGLAGPQGNHGEDVKELYYYLDSTPCHSYMKALYKYPQAAFPYDELVQESARRDRKQDEYEIEDTGVFDDDKYWDVFAEFAKNSEDDILIKYSICNRGNSPASIHVLPQLWFRNCWSWGGDYVDYSSSKPRMEAEGTGTVLCSHHSLGRYQFTAWKTEDGKEPQMLFTENETNKQVVFKTKNVSPYTKDAFDSYIVNGDNTAVNPKQQGTKCAAHYTLEVAAGQSTTIRCRLHKNTTKSITTQEFDKIFDLRKTEADAFYAQVIPRSHSKEEYNVARQAYAGLLWTKQLFYYDVNKWLDGDKVSGPSSEKRLAGRNHEWRHLYNCDIISMPDKWEYPWYAAWDLAFHMLPFADIDPSFTKDQLLLFLSERYMHPNGQLPAYEFAFSDVNPPVHAWACLKVYQVTATRGQPDLPFLKAAFNKLVLNFMWWVNKKDPESRHIFAGGFLGMDNISLFDRSQQLPIDGEIDQADGTGWMGFFSLIMLEIALELARNDSTYVDMANKFLEHFMHISAAINGKNGLWDEKDGFYYDFLRTEGQHVPLRIRSYVGLVPLFAGLTIEQSHLEDIPGFAEKFAWFRTHRKEHAAMIQSDRDGKRHFLCLPSKDKIRMILSYMLDQNEFLSPHGLRSLSKVYEKKPYILKAKDFKKREKIALAWDSTGTGKQSEAAEVSEFSCQYAGGESNIEMFGGNSNWRGPIWLCINQLVIEALERLDYFYGDDLRVQCPTGSGNYMRPAGVADDLCQRITSTLLPDAQGRRPIHAHSRLAAKYAKDPHWKDLVLFYELFHGDTGRGVGASHQTGWTALVVNMMQRIAHNK